jgi:hypothetical protein
MLPAMPYCHHCPCYPRGRDRLTKYANGVYSTHDFFRNPEFTRLISALLVDDEYSKLQEELVKRPDAGDLIKDGGGIRKFRWKRPGTGKSGGIWIIYYWLTEDNQILMLVAYPKSTKDNLNDKETAVLRKLVKEL